MASIDGSGRSRGVAQTSDLDQAQRGDAAERKGKDKGKRPFAALQNRRGSVERAVHTRKKETDFSSKLDKGLRSKTDDILRSMKAKKGGKEQATARQAETPQKPPRVLQQTPARVSVKGPQKPPRPEVLKDTAGTAKTLGRAGPPKPDRSDISKTSATLPRPQAKPRTVFGGAEAKAQPVPAPRTGIPSEKPVAATRTLLSTQGQAQTGATKASAQGNYDVLQNVPLEAQRGIRYPTMKSAQGGQQAPGRTAERATPRLRQRPLEDSKFLQGGGFNPSKTLNNPKAGQTLRGLEASVRTPAPPRLSIGTRIMNSLKIFFRIGTPVPQRAAVSQQGQMYSRLAEERLEDLLIRKPELNTGKQLVFETAEREINRNIRSITANVKDGEYTARAKENVSNAMQRIEALFVEYETLEEAVGQGDDNA